VAADEEGGAVSWAEGYVEVRERMAWFFERYPEGSLQSEILPSPIEGVVVVRAYAYRHPDDPRPGVGIASEPVPGKTPYTRDSELMNAETSAWGRALAAIGAPTRDHVASANEVRARRPAEVVGEGTEAGQRTGGGDRHEGDRDTTPAAPSSSGCPTCGEPWGPRTTSSGKRLCVRGHVERA
jgi:hypothetical protein